jgi:deazaflavin-dependent oxidoreductase (nitroreductase family)
VVRYDATTGTYYVAVGFGTHSDWYQNVLANPSVEVRSAGKHVKATAIPLSSEEAGTELVKYSHQHSTAFRELVRFMGYRVDGTDKDTFQLGQFIKMFALKPKEE